jgi:hypothetical protein
MVPRSHYADHEFGIGCTPDLLAFDHDRGCSGVIRSECGVTDFPQSLAWR